METMLRQWMLVCAAVCSILLSLPVKSAFSPADIAMDAKYQGVGLSPDGSKIAVGMQIEGKRRLLVLSLADFAVLGAVNLGSAGEVGDFFWVNDERLLIEVWRRQPWEAEGQNYGELYAVNFDGSRGQMVYGFAVQQQSLGSNIKGKEATRGWAGIVHLLPDDNRHVLISSTPMTKSGGVPPSLHKLNVYNGKMSPQITRAPVAMAKFITDKTGHPRLVVGTNAEGDTKIFSRNNDDWQEVSDSFGMNFQPIALTDDSQKLIFLDDLAQDKVGLFSLDLATSKRAVIYNDDAVSLTSVNLTVDKTSAYAVRVDDGRPTYVLFNDAGEEAALFKNLLATFPGYKVTIVSRADNAGLWALYVSNDIDPGTYFLFDAKQNNLTQLFANLDHIDIDDFSETSPFSFTASDGMTLHGFITYPVGVPADKPAPLVTLVHGGPHGVRDYWGFDREVQLLAAQGYAVLQVNYRGSGGYGRDYQAAGYLRWGDRIQQDIIEGTAWARAQPRIDQDRVCIMGASFGAYSAVMSAALAPEIFKCAVAFAGVYDLTLMRESGDIPDMLWGKSYLDRAIGKDPATLTAFSPVQHVAKLSGPVFIAHGERDKRVPFEHARRLRAALAQAGKPYVWFVKDNESHGFFDEENRATYYLAVTQFLKQHL